MEVALVVLGAILALGGSMVVQAASEAIARNRDELAVLREAEETLLSLHAFMQARYYKSIAGPNDLSLEDQRSILDIERALAAAAIRLRSSRSRDIAVRLIKLGHQPELRTRGNVYSLTREVQLRLNSKVIERYEREIEESPQTF